jgi:hypothetical protein
MATPEGKVKDNVKKLLHKEKIYPAKDAGNFPLNARGWYYMPTQSGMGVSGIPDFIGVYLELFWGIETKAEGKKPTGFQQLQIEAIETGTGKVFVVDGDESLKEFEEWLKEIRQ